MCCLQISLVEDNNEQLAVTEPSVPPVIPAVTGPSVPPQQNFPVLVAPFIGGHFDEVERLKTQFHEKCYDPNGEHCGRYQVRLFYRSNNTLYYRKNFE